jgi:hypothetical protein
MRSRLFFAYLALLVLSLLRTKATHTVDTSKPLNLLIVTTDDKNADSAGWSGSLGFQTCKNQFLAKRHRGAFRGPVLCILSNGLNCTGHPTVTQPGVPNRCVLVLV